MKRKSKLNLILSGILAFLLVVTIFLQVIKPSATFQHVDNFFYTTTSYIRHFFIEKPVNSMKDFTLDFMNLRNVQRENDMYRQYLLQMNQMATQIEATARDNQALKDLLDLNTTLVEYDLLNSTVISRSHASFNQSIVIDVGAQDGIATHMAVLNAQGVIGVVETVNDNSSIVKLMTNEDSLNKYSVLIQIDSTTTINAVLEGYSSEDATFEVRLLDSSVSIDEGMKVITSGLGEIIPTGLLIGTIERIEDRSTTLSVIAHVKPAADFTHLNYVSVVKTGPLNDH